jgi:hypothetical protein
MNSIERTFKENNEMSDDVLEKEVEQDVIEAEQYEAGLPEGIKKGSGEKEWEHLYEKDSEFAAFLERFPNIIEAFGELVISEVLKGEIKKHPKHFELLKKLFVLFERNKALFEDIAGELSEERKKKDALRNTR